jgi:UDP-glucose 4-epimerase
MKKVIISGSNGYIGAIACQYFEDKGWQVLKACRQDNADIWCDLDSPEQFAGLTIDSNVNLFIHTAAAHEVTCKEQPYRSIYQNVAGTRAALDFCVKNHIEHFIYLSTFHVFGHPQGEINESTEPLPVNDYGLSHLQAEQYVQMYTREGRIKGLVIRPSNGYGIPVDIDKFKRWTLVPVDFCREAIGNHKIVLRTPGLQKRNFVSIPDVCRVMEKSYSLIDKIYLLHVYGVDTISIKAFAELVKNVMRNNFNEEVELVIPQNTSSLPSSKSGEFTYTSKYLQEIHEPSDRIEDFIVDFCTLLKSRK